MSDTLPAVRDERVHDTSGVRTQADIELVEPRNAPEPFSTQSSSALPNRCALRTHQARLLVSGFFMTFLVIGINTSYGIFQDFYTSPDTNINGAEGRDALVALVGTIGYGLTWSGAILVNALMTKLPAKVISLAGAILISLSFVLASFSTELWHLYLTQALLFGVGASLLYFPLMSLTPQFFDKHRGFAMGFILAGSGVGGLVFAPLLHLLITRYGIRWTLRIIGLSSLVLSIPVAIVDRQPSGFTPGGPTRHRPGTSLARVNVRLLKNRTFIAQSFGAVLQASGNNVPLVYLPSYSTSILNYSSSTGSLLLAMNNGVNSLSRIMMGVLADFVGRQNTLISSVILSGIAVLALWYNAARARFIAFVVLYGIYAGGYNALLPTVIAEVHGAQNYDGANGLIYFLRGLGMMFGSPVAGVILGTHGRGSAGALIQGMIGLTDLKKRYRELVIFDAVLLLGAACCVIFVRWQDAREKGVWKWKA